MVRLIAIVMVWGSIAFAGYQAVKPPAAQNTRTRIEQSVKQQNELNKSTERRRRQALRRGVDADLARGAQPRQSPLSRLVGKLRKPRLPRPR